MVKIKPLDTIRQNYANSAGRAAQNYKEEVARTTGWQQAAIKGQSNYVAQMSNAEVLAKREKKLQQTSDEVWRQGASTKGAARIGEGIRQGANDQAAGYASIHAALASMELPDKTTDANTNIDQR